MVEYSTYARQEMRARQKFFQHDILWWILYILGIFKILISFKSIAIDAFEYWIFSWKIQKKFENFQNFPNREHFFGRLGERVKSTPSENFFDHPKKVQILTLKW